MNMFGEQATQWSAPGNFESNLAFLHSQGQSDTRIVHDQYQYQGAPNPPSYPQDTIVSSLGLFGMFPFIGYPQDQEHNFQLNKNSAEPAAEPIAVSPKSLSFCGPQMTGPLTPTAGLGLHTSQLIQPEAFKSSFSIIGYGSTTPSTTYENNEGGNMGYETGTSYQVNNENVGLTKEEFNYAFNSGFKSDLDSSMSTDNPPASLERSQLDQHGLYGPDISHLLDSIFKESASMPVDSTRDDCLPGYKPPTLVQQVGLNLPTRNQINVNSHQRPERGHQAGVLKPLQNRTPEALGGISDQEMKPANKQLPKYFPGENPEILELPRIARNPPNNFPNDIGTDQFQKRKFSDEEADQSFISCRTIKTTRRVMTGGKNSRGAATYCPLITVSIPSVPWIPEINCGSKTNSKTANSRRSKAGSTLQKKAKVEKH
ncbi:hypothetical protein PTTG_11732 [Puccinia triticina 1-1 BBBD Race 1]|uniref:Uncharacterized protein n=2 Tax=Puccinia triticina TaxID=208348 RepID=A0A180H4X0_PUCT1|nr:uncharacterized protein PtA15_2A428 [Puccinia triticina]OAV99619.1 hypothetical protein PTTG_11732 [Puccinia triticina 1-1 BBBD Race 1]WAQ82115.1 hypothetical protein PtA15_2A428 [Puccinia triticina]WAR52978.1 hypothetical protein PtB15_2B406 [Puccinia triticina]